MCSQTVKFQGIENLNTAPPGLIQSLAYFQVRMLLRRMHSTVNFNFKQAFYKFVFKIIIKKTPTKQYAHKFRSLGHLHFYFVKRHDVVIEPRN